MAHHGTVKFFSDSKGFGFISVDGGQDIFVAAKDIAGNPLYQDDNVTFDIEENRKGKTAKNVKGGTGNPFKGKMKGIGKMARDYDREHGQGASLALGGKIKGDVQQTSSSQQINGDGTSKGKFGKGDGKFGTSKNGKKNGKHLRHHNGGGGGGHHHNGGGGGGHHNNGNNNKGKIDDEDEDSLAGKANNGKGILPGGNHHWVKGKGPMALDWNDASSYLTSYPSTTNNTNNIMGNNGGPPIMMGSNMGGPYNHLGGGGPPMNGISPMSNNINGTTMGFDNKGFDNKGFGTNGGFDQGKNSSGFDQGKNSSGFGKGSFDGGKGGPFDAGKGGMDQGKGPISNPMDQGKGPIGGGGMAGGQPHHGVGGPHGHGGGGYPPNDPRNGQFGGPISGPQNIGRNMQMGMYSSSGHSSHQTTSSTPPIPPQKFAGLSVPNGPVLDLCQVMGPGSRHHH